MSREQEAIVVYLKVTFLNLPADTKKIFIGSPAYN
jgi:hypothetical protein